MISGVRFEPVLLVRYAVQDLDTGTFFTGFWRDSATRGNLAQDIGFHMTQWTHDHRRRWETDDLEQAYIEAALLTELGFGEWRTIEVVQVVLA